MKKTATLFKRKLKDGSTSLYLIFYNHENKRVQKSLNLYLYPRQPKENQETMRKAEMIVADYIREQSEKEEDNSNLTLYKLLSLTSEGEKLMVSVNALCQVIDNVSVEYIEKNGEIWAMNVRKKIEGMDKKKNTKNIYLSELKKLLNIGVTMKYLKHNPLNEVKGIGIEDAEPEYLNSDELFFLKAAVNSRMNKVLVDAFFFACNTGLRISDIERLKWENIRYNRDKGTYTLYILMKKTNIPVIIPLNKTAMDILKKYEGVNPIFKLPSRRCISRSMNLWGERAGLDKRLRFHMSRHTAATLMLQAGVDVVTVCKILGHSSVNTTMKYLSVVDKTKEDATKKLERMMGI